MNARRRHIIHLLHDLMRTLPISIGVIPERLQSVFQSAGTVILFEAEVIVVRTGEMFLDDEARIALELILIPEIQRRP